MRKVLNSLTFYETKRNINNLVSMNLLRKFASEINNKLIL